MKKLLIVAATAAAITVSGSAFAVNTLQVSKNQMQILNEVANIMASQTTLNNYAVLGTQAADTFDTALYDPQAAAGNPGYGYVSVSQTNYASTGAFTLTLDGSAVYSGLDGISLTFSPVGPNDTAFATGTAGTMNSDMAIKGWGCVVASDPTDDAFGTLAAYKSTGHGNLTVNLIKDNPTPQGIDNMIASCTAAS